MHTRPPSADPQGSAPERDGAYNVRSVPVRIYLPDGPVLQDLVPPLLEDGASDVLGSDLVIDINPVIRIRLPTYPSPFLVPAYPSIVPPFSIGTSLP